MCRVCSAERRYLLILACSRRKRRVPGSLPAIERYDGVNYRVLRKAKREGRWPRRLDVLILSAKHGLLEPGASIESYDLLMTPERAKQLRPAVLASMTERLSATKYEEVFLNVGKTYRLAMNGWDAEVGRETRIIYADGGIGQKAGAMLRWLNEKADVSRKDQLVRC